jgi:hypothetical protein
MLKATLLEKNHGSIELKLAIKLLLRIVMRKKEFTKLSLHKTNAPTLRELERLLCRVGHSSLVNLFRTVTLPSPQQAPPLEQAPVVSQNGYPRTSHHRRALQF